MNNMFKNTCGNNNKKKIARLAHMIKSENMHVKTNFGANIYKAKIFVRNIE